MSDDKPFIISFKEPYLSDWDMRNAKHSEVTKIINVAGVDEERKMKLVKVRIHDNIFKAYVDCVTGSLYIPKTGVCLSSTQLFMR